MAIAPRSIEACLALMRIGGGAAYRIVAPHKGEDETHDDQCRYVFYATHCRCNLRNICLNSNWELPDHSGHRH